MDRNDLFFDLSKLKDIPKMDLVWDRNSFDVRRDGMFFYKLKNGRLINMDQIEMIDISLTGVNITMSTGTVIFVSRIEWKEFNEIIESYRYKEIEG